MKKQTVVSLGFVAVVLLAWAVALHWNTESSEQTQLWLPSLASRVGDVDHIVIDAGDDGQLHLDKGPEGWQVREKFAYPASVERIRELAQGLSEARVKAIKTADPKKLERLNLAETGGEHGGVHVQLLAGDEVIADVLLGKEGPSFKGRYVRKMDGTQSWLVDQALSVSSKTDDWLDKTIVDVSPNQIRKVVYEGDDANLTAERKTPDDQHFTLQPIPDDRVLAYEGAADIADTVLLGLTLDDVMPREKADQGQPVRQTLVETFDGRRFTVRQYEPEEGETWIEIDLTFDPELVQSSGTAEPKGKQDKDGTSASETTVDVAALKAEAERLAKRLSRWRYKVSPYQAGALRKTIKDFTREKESDKKKEKAASR
jgi:hypothetical protein